MARKPMITRTIMSTRASVLCLNVETAEPTTELFELARTYKDEDKLMKALKAQYENESTKLVHITDIVEVEKLYGMSETDFMLNAVELDPTTRKPLSAGVDESYESDEE